MDVVKCVTVYRDYLKFSIFPFELISVCVAALKARLSAKKLHYSHGFDINVGVQRTRRA